MLRLLESIQAREPRLQPALYVNSEIRAKDLMGFCWQIADGLVSMSDTVRKYA